MLPGINYKCSSEKTQLPSAFKKGVTELTTSISFTVFLCVLNFFSKVSIYPQLPINAVMCTDLYVHVQNHPPSEVRDTPALTMAPLSSAAP